LHKIQDMWPWHSSAVTVGVTGVQTPQTFRLGFATALWLAIGF